MNDSSSSKENDNAVLLYSLRSKKHCMHLVIKNKKIFGKYPFDDRFGGRSREDQSLF